jgi:TonB family protein
MKLDINRYIRYCLFLFDNCTVNGLGTFQILQSPPKLDHNGNYVQEEKYTINFNQNHTEKPRLSFLLASKENCTEEEAELSIKKYVKNIFEEIASKNEVWFKELGMLIKKNGELRFLSHKFTSKELKQQVATQTSLLQTYEGEKPQTVTKPFDEIPAYSLTTEDIDLQHGITEKDTAFNSFTNPALKPVLPPAKNNSNIHVVEDERIAAAAFVSAIPVKSTDNTLSAVKSKVINIKLSPKVKKSFTYGVSIAGCLVLSYFLYSFLSGNKNNIEAKNYLLAAGTTPTKQENTTNKIITDGTGTNEKEIMYGKTAVYTIPVISKNDKTTTANEPVKEKKNENEIAKPNNTITTQPLDNNNFVANNTVFEKQAQTSPGETATAIPEPAVQLKPAVKVEITPEKEKKVSEKEMVTDAEFPGGKDKMAKFLTQKLIYPESAIEEAKEGISLVKIFIDKTGKVKSLEILNSLGADFDMEIKRVVGRMPQWSPAKKNGEPVESSYNFRVNFKNVNKLLPR